MYTIKLITQWGSNEENAVDLNDVELIGNTSLGDTPRDCLFLLANIHDETEDIDISSSNYDITLDETKLVSGLNAIDKNFFDLRINDEIVEKNNFDITFYSPDINTQVGENINIYITGLSSEEDSSDASEENAGSSDNTDPVDNNKIKYITRLITDNDTTYSFRDAVAVANFDELKKSIDTAKNNMEYAEHIVIGPEAGKNLTEREKSRIESIITDFLNEANEFNEDTAGVIQNALDRLYNKEEIKDLKENTFKVFNVPENVTLTEDIKNKAMSLDSLKVTSKQAAFTSLYLRLMEILLLFDDYIASVLGDNLNTFNNIINVDDDNEREFFKFLKENLSRLYGISRYFDKKNAKYLAEALGYIQQDNGMWTDPENKTNYLSLVSENNVQTALKQASDEDVQNIFEKFLTDEYVKRASDCKDVLDNAHNLSDEQIKFILNANELLDFVDSYEYSKS